VVIGQFPWNRHTIRQRSGKAYLQLEILEGRTLLSANVRTAFGGIGYPQSQGHAIPEAGVAVGPNQVVEIINSTIAVYDRAGHKLSQQYLADFFRSVDGGLFPYQPVLTYDELTGRFVVGALTFSGYPQTSTLLVAVSNDSDPTHGFTEMHALSLKESIPNNSYGTETFFADDIRLGYNADAYAFSFNMPAFPFPTSPVPTFAASGDHVQLVTLEKSSLLDRNNATLVQYRRDLSANSNYTLDPATMPESAAGGPLWFVEVSYTKVNAIRVVKETNVLSNAPTFTPYDIAVPAYGLPPNALQPGGQVSIGDDSMLSVNMRGRRLVAAHTVGVNGTVRARWYEFNVGRATPTLTQSGDINRAPAVSTYDPAVAIARTGELGLTYMESSAKEFVSMYVTGQIFGAFAGLLQTPVLVARGQASYKSSGTIADLVGNYSGIAVDPQTGAFWAASAYATLPAPDNWGTWITSFSMVWPTAAKTPAADALAPAASDTFFEQELLQALRTAEEPFAIHSRR
jgi:hypothetical protein